MRNMAGLSREIERFRADVEALRNTPFDEKAILALIRRLLTVFAPWIPKARLERRRHKWICSFGIPGMALIMIEPAHGSRSAIPFHWRHQMLDTVEEILDRIEAAVKRKK
jgi:hypothetical protein